MAVTLDITGERYGRWTVIGPAPRDGRIIKWHCRCYCGNEGDVIGFSLKAGGSLSCGCFQKEAVSRRATTHGMHKHPAYSSYRAMISRCKHASNPSWKDYGGRGITVCEAWSTFEGFWRDMGPTWFLSGTIDREDNDGNYEPSNCRWLTAKGQANNRRDNLAVNIGGEVMTLTQVAERFGVKRNTLEARRRYGFSEDELLVPVKNHRTKINTPDGPMLIPAAAKKAGLPVRTVRARIRRGWPEADLLIPAAERTSRQ